MNIKKAVVLPLSEPQPGPMVSGLPSFLHPVAGRPLIWHTVSSLLAIENPPREILVLTPAEFPAEVLGELGPHVTVRTFDPAAIRSTLAGQGSSAILIAHGSASLDPTSLRRLVGSEVGSWIGGADSQAAAALASAGQLMGMLEANEPFTVPNGFLSPLRRIEATAGTFVVQNRDELARLQGRIRDQLVRTLMDAGATFLIPESVLVDVDVRIGSDTVIYPGVVLEGTTTIGAETVVGPGCRIVDSWIGSGVELKGWNYVSHASVRNRSILEPYVRRGFD